MTPMMTKSTIQSVPNQQMSTFPECTAPLQEIFSSIQGEGIDVGHRQLFVRFNGCHLQCAYCDTPAQSGKAPCRIEPHSGSGEYTFVENPMTMTTLLTWITWFNTQYRHHSISFTGGEPLLYAPFLQELLPHVAPILPVYLETSGTQPEALTTVLPWITTVAMDIKLESSTGEPLLLAEQQAFYQLSRSCRLFVKLVVASNTTLEELAVLPQIVTDPSTPVILQPMMDPQTGQNTVPGGHLLTLEHHLSRHFADVRVIPQTHKIMALA